LNWNPNLLDAGTGWTSFSRMAGRSGAKRMPRRDSDRQTDRWVSLTAVAAEQLAQGSLLGPSRAYCSLHSAFRISPKCVQ
jgi:hypothetical protein